MFKRNKSYLLLTFLVLTGFGGRIHSNLLPGKERKGLIKELKESKKTLVQVVAGLDQKQLDFKASPEDWSVRDNIYHLANCEEVLWNWTQTAMKEKSKNGNIAVPFTNNNPSENFNSDMELENDKALSPSSIRYKNINEALDKFTSNRMGVIKFVRTTTDDIRTCQVKCSAGETNSYDLLLSLSEHTKKHIEQIETLKNNPNFPK